MTSPRALGASLGALVLAAVLFAAWPSLDVTTASLFYAGTGRFIGQGHLGDEVRRVFAQTPFVVLGLTTLLAIARKVTGSERLWAPNVAGLLLMALSLALGPGLLVNVVLKDHSHRPRPYYLHEFGGPADFRPFYRFDGSCPRNCSFASGEGATAFWTLAPALLVPGPAQPIAIAAALVYGTSTSLLRMAFGGHFLSDTVLAALLTWLVILMCWHAVARLTGREPASLPVTSARPIR